MLQGEGDDVLFYVPWARKPSVSHQGTSDKMKLFLAEAGFKILNVHDSTDDSQRWFEAKMARLAKTGPPPLGTHNRVV